MTEETAKALAEAMNRLAAAIESVPKTMMGIQVYHSGYVGGPAYQPSMPALPSWPSHPGYYPWGGTTWGGQASGCTDGL